MRIASIVPGLLAAASLPVPASADLQFFTDEAAFLAAVGGNPLVFEDFELVTPGVPTTGLSSKGALWSAPGAEVVAEETNLAVSGRALVRTPVDGGNIVASLEKPAHAFGGFVASNHPYVFGSDIVVSLVVNDQQLDVLIDDDQHRFLGVLSDEAFSSVLLTSFTPIDGAITEPHFGIDNVRFSGTVVPAPGAALALAPVACLASVRRRREH